MTACSNSSNDGDNNSVSPTASLQGGWDVALKNNILEIVYGSGSQFPQYAALHLDSSYFRMNYGSNSGWGTSVVLLPSFWQGGILYQGAPVTASWQIEGNNLLLLISGTISGLQAHIVLQIFPPGQSSISASVSVNVTGNVTLDPRFGEEFKPVMLSSMHISPDVWDTQSAYVGSQMFSIPESGWITSPPKLGETFGLQGGASSWKNNAPTIEIVLENSWSITGWVTPSSDPNDDNVGFWAASNHVVTSWNYTMIAKP